MKTIVPILASLFLAICSSASAQQDSNRDMTTGIPSMNGFSVDKGITDIHGRVIYQSMNVHQALKFGKITKKQANVLNRDLYRIHQDALNAYRNGQGLQQLTPGEVKKFEDRLDANQKALDDLMNPPKAVPSPTPEAKPTPSH